MTLFKNKKHKLEQLQSKYMESLNIPQCLTDDFELVITEVFTLIGIGTVVTGTINRGACKVGDNIQILTTSDILESTITDIQLHNEKYRKQNGYGYKTEFVGIAIRGISKEQLQIGDKLIRKGGIA